MHSALFRCWRCRPPQDSWYHNLVAIWALDTLGVSLLWLDLSMLTTISSSWSFATLLVLPLGVDIIPVPATPRSIFSAILTSWAYIQTITPSLLLSYGTRWP